MKKYTLFLFIFIFILLGFLGFNVKSAKAYDYGCTEAGPYSTITGQLCVGSQYDGYAGSQYDSSSNFLNQQFQIGSRGVEVIALQQMLTNAGFSIGRIDGIYGSKTDRAFLDYLAQYSNNYSYPYSNPYSNQNPYPFYNQAPTISGINGPQTLNVNQIGTWTVTAFGSNNGNLTYSIDWGDQPLYAHGANNSSVLPQQNAMFTHTYTQAGTYRPVFTVANSSGQSVSASLSVVVSGPSNYVVPVIYSISPTYGPPGIQVTISGTGFINNVYNNGCTAYYCGSGVTTNTVNFGGSVIQNVYSYSGTSLTFAVPSNLNTCYAGQYCAQFYAPVNPGIYPISVTNANGISNSVNFTVTY
ncbi:MAG: IPT/TIG domain-containing protein [bacterium]